MPVEQALFLIRGADVAREFVARLGDDRAQLRLRDLRFGENDRLALALRMVSLMCDSHMPHIMPSIPSVI